MAKLIAERERYGGRRTTLAAIAAEAGVSLAVVSKVLNGRPDVAPDTRDRVRRLLDDRHYARRSSPGRRGPRLFSIVVDGLVHPWTVEILRGIESWSTEHAAGIMVSAAALTSVLDASHCDGAILATTRPSAAQIGELRAARVPVVVIDLATAPPADLPSVGATNWAGGLAATEHLLALGHQRISIITGPANFHCSLARLDGYRSALEGAGVTIDPGLVRYGDFSSEGAFAAATELLALTDPPTAVFAGSDQQAFGVYQAARRRGLRIPEDLSVVGFDDLPAARWASPQLTTVWQPLAEMGGTAAQMLGDLIENRPLHPNRVELSTELIVRESTAAAPPRNRPTAP